MIVVSDTTALAEHLTPLRDRADRIAFVPTMGNLHDGHLALVHQAREVADVVVVSIFVNPMQFAAHEDLDTYPRTLDDDLSALREAAVDLVLTPSADDIYPDTSARHTAIHVPVLGEALCGKDRPGHFDGVCTVVYKLFQLVGPDIAVFGEKDLQQLLIIKKMVADLSLPIDKDFVRPRPEGQVQAMFFGLGSDGTVGANKASVKIIGEGTDLYSQGHFVYDSKKSGAVTVAPRPRARTSARARRRGTPAPAPAPLTRPGAQRPRPPQIPEGAGQGGSRDRRPLPRRGCPRR